MGTTKLSVTVEEQLVREVRALVGERGVSAFVTRAVRHELESERLAGFVAELEHELGPPDEQMMTEAEAAFDRAEAANEAMRVQRSRRRAG
jgi:hypothetical protein